MGIVHRVGGLDAVVEAHQEGPQPCPGDEAHGFDPGVDGFEAQRLEEPELGQREDLEGDLHDHPGRPLGTEEEVAQIRSDGGTRDHRRLHPLTGGEHDGERNHQVLDAAVARRELAGAAGGDPAAHRRTLEGLGRVTEGVAARLQLVLKLETQLAGLDADQEVDLVEKRHPRHRRQVEGHSAADRQRRPGHRGAEPPRGNGHTALRGPPHQPRDQLGRGRPNHDRGPVRLLSLLAPLDGHRPGVAAVQLQVGAVGGERPTSQQLGQLRDPPRRGGRASAVRFQGRTHSATPRRRASSVSRKVASPSSSWGPTTRSALSRAAGMASAGTTARPARLSMATSLSLSPAAIT